MSAPKSEVLAEACVLWSLIFGFFRYKDLSSDESLVYSVIESSGRTGAWVKTIKGKLNLHQKNVDQSIKALIQRGYIKSMSTVKHPQRKMYILAGLQPGEDATGGAWFTDGVLDHELMEILAKALEWKISELSWHHVTDLEGGSAGTDLGVSQKRKKPDDTTNAASQGKEKMRRTEAGGAAHAVLGSSGAEGDDQDRLPPEKRHVDLLPSEKIYVPYDAGHHKYPTLKYLTDFVNDSDVIQLGKIPQNNVSQLLDVMAYDDKIVKVRSSTDGSVPTMYKARRTLAQLNAEAALDKRIRNTDLEEAKRMKAFRETEIKKLGSGGMTEIPCGRCPVFDMCEVGGPVNPTNCEYFEEWFKNLEIGGEAQEGGLTW